MDDMTHNLSIEHIGSHLNKPLKTNNRLIGYMSVVLGYLVLTISSPIDQ
jgi:hypothetical protein